jgi:hypothetical protein
MNHPLYRTASSVGTVFGVDQWAPRIDAQISEHPEIWPRGTSLDVDARVVGTRYRSSLPQHEAEAIVRQAHEDHVPSAISSIVTSVEEFGDQVVVASVNDAADVAREVKDIAGDTVATVGAMAKGGTLKWIAIAVVAYYAAKIVGIVR